MKLAHLVARLPVYASDLQANFDGLVVRRSDDGDVLRWGTIVAAAMVSGSAALTQAALLEATEHLPPAQLHSAKLAATMMSLTNNFYRHRSLTAQPQLKELRGGLRTARLRQQEKTGITFKLWCVAVSVLNGCAACVEANERGAIEGGATPEQIADVLRVGALIRAIAVVVETELVLEQPQSVADIYHLA